MLNFNESSFMTIHAFFLPGVGQLFRNGGCLTPEKQGVHSTSAESAPNAINVI